MDPSLFLNNQEQLFGLDQVLCETPSDDSLELVLSDFHAGSPLQKDNASKEKIIVNYLKNLGLVMKTDPKVKENTYYRFYHSKLIGKIRLISSSETNESYFDQEQFMEESISNQEINTCSLKINPILLRRSKESQHQSVQFTSIKADSKAKYLSLNDQYFK